MELNSWTEQFRQYFQEYQQYSWLVGVALGLVAFLVLETSILFLGGRIESLSKRLNSGLGATVATILKGTKHFFLAALAIYIGILPLNLDDRWMIIANKTMILAFLLQFYVWGSHVIKMWLNIYAEEKMAVDAAQATTVRAVGFLIRVGFAVAIFLLALDNLGVNVTALVAGLGVGGIAVGLAVQNILGDLFSSFTIVLDRPFVIGDFIIVDTFQGTVEHVGLKSTRLRSLSGELLVFGNSDLLKARIANYKQMRERRIVFQFGVVYQTTAAQLKAIPEIVKAAITQLPGCRLERVHFFQFGASSLDFEVVYWVNDPQYTVYMDRQQAINLYLFEQFEAKGIDFAYPTQTIFVEKDGAHETKEPTPKREPAPRLPMA